MVTTSHGCTMDRVTSRTNTATTTTTGTVMGQIIIMPTTVTTTTTSGRHRSTRGPAIGQTKRMAGVEEDSITIMDGSQTEEEQAEASDVITKRSAAPPRCRLIHVNKSCIYKV